MAKKTVSDQDILALLQARLAGDTSSPESTPSADATTDSTVFWARMRGCLAANADSMGLQHLDALAEAIVKGEPSPTLPGLALVLPPSDYQYSSGHASAHPLFLSPAKTGFKRSSPSKSSKTASTRSIKKPGRVAQPSKKQVVKSDPKSAKAVDYLRIDPQAPQDVIDALQHVVDEAEAHQKLAHRLAYPWSQRRLWYDPKVYSNAYLAHYRFWMAHRRLFWNWAIHYSMGSANAARRKQKLAAVRARLQFLSLCIETWGYYAFLDRFKRANSHDTVFWLGGQPGKQSAEAKATGSAKGPTVDDLSYLYEKNHQRYTAILDNALDPDLIDYYGCDTIPDLLVLTNALDPEADVIASRLSDRALARICIDITSDNTPRGHWVGDTKKGVWRDLLANDRIRDLQAVLEKEHRAGSYELPTVPAYDAQCDDDSDFSDYEDDSGVPTALPPTPAAEAVESSGEEEDQGAEGGDEDEEKPQVPLKAVPATRSRSSR